MNNCFSIYHTSLITGGEKSDFACLGLALFATVLEAILFFFGSSGVNSALLVASGLAGRRGGEALYTKSDYFQVVTNPNPIRFERFVSALATDLPREMEPA